MTFRTGIVWLATALALAAALGLLPRAEPRDFRMVTPPQLQDGQTHV